jgi:hypothetical protein
MSSPDSSLAEMEIETISNWNNRPSDSELSGRQQLGFAHCDSISSYGHRASITRRPRHHNRPAWQSTQYSVLCIYISFALEKPVENVTSTRMRQLPTGNDEERHVI